MAAWPAAAGPELWLGQSSGNANLARIDLLTPLCVKDGNVACCGAFEFSQLVRRLHKRIAQLCESAGEAPPLARAFTESQHRLSESVRLMHSDIQWMQVKRQSSRSGQNMVLEGMTGHLIYRGNLAPFTGLLALGKVLQLGAKTAFGFGRIDTHFSFED